jgi:Flp pilus assembly pilin Flp
MKNQIKSILKAPFKKNKKGQSMVEYGLILALVSIVAITVLKTMGDQISATVTKVNTQMQDVTKITPPKS